MRVCDRQYSVTGAAWLPASRQSPEIEPPQ